MFRSTGGFDSVFGRAGKDVFRADLPYLTEAGQKRNTNQVGYNLINDYEYAERFYRGFWPNASR